MALGARSAAARGGRLKPASPHPPTLAVVIPATDGPSTLSRCLQAVRAARSAPEELIVVTEPAGTGPAAARNRGAEQASADVVVFLDSDIEVHRDAFARIRARMGDDPGLTAVFGSLDEFPEHPAVVSRFRNLLHHHVHQQNGGPAATFAAGIGAVRRDAFLAAGGFDEALFPIPSCEDIELGMRLTRGGARIDLDPALKGTHLKRWTLPAMIREDFARRGVPWVAILLRERRRSAENGRRPDGAPAPQSALNLAWPHRLSAAASVLAVLALLARRGKIAAGATLLLVLLNRGFYALLLRRMGPAGAAAGVPLHIIHHLTGAAAVPAGVRAYRRGPW